MNQSRLYRRAFALLGGFTPLRADCGALCEKRCCGGDAETGMLLFPGEKTSLPVKTVGGRTLVVCGGVCDRDARPLACRLFPLFPVPDGHGGLKAAPDVRGGLCPLVQHAEDVAFSPRRSGDCCCGTKAAAFFFSRSGMRWTKRVKLRKFSKQLDLLFKSVLQ